MLFVAMTAVGLAYVGYNLYEVQLATSGYGAAQPGMTRDETRYMFGPPPPGSGGGRAALWRYRDGPAMTSMRFDETGRIAAAGCTDTTGGQTGCPGVLGVTIGSGEDQVADLLGAPERVAYSGNSKVIVYPDLGLRFQLRRYAVSAIQSERRTSRFSYLPRAIRMLLP